MTEPDNWSPPAVDNEPDWANLEDWCGAGAGTRAASGR
jgi:hypothetical protein